LVTVHLSEGSFVRKVWDRVGVMAWARVRVRARLRLGLESVRVRVRVWLGLGLASNLRICTTTFWTNDSSDK